MKIAIGSDKSGFSAKEAIKAYLTEAGIEFDDLGTQDLDHVVPYYAVADKVAPLVQQGEYDKAVLICGTGAGMCVVSNKFKGRCLRGRVLGKDGPRHKQRQHSLHGRLDSRPRNGRRDGQDLPCNRMVPRP